MKYKFNPSGVCARELQLEIEDGKIKNLKTIGGCDGNLKGISRLVQDQDAKQVAKTLQGTACRSKGTSCPDQISKAIESALEIEKEQSRLHQDGTFSVLCKDDKLEMLRRMYISRFFELKVNDMFCKQMIHGTTHLGVGQEANHAGVAFALEHEDWFLPTHRGHGHFIGKGGKPLDMMRELFALKSGCSKGLGGSMHLIDLDNYNMGSSGVVAGAIPIAVGMAFALKYKKINNLVVSFLGDGASNQGMALESLNLASVWEVPVLFYCENNMYGMSAPAKKYIGGGNLTKRAESFGVEAVRIDGNDLVEVYETVKKASEKIKQTKKPFFIEAMTYRWLGHSKSDQRKYRTKEEEKEYKDKCPIKRYEKYLLHNDICSNEEIDYIRENASSEIEHIVARCIKEQGDYLTTSEMLNFVY